MKPRDNATDTKDQIKRTYPKVDTKMKRGGGIKDQRNAFYRVMESMQSRSVEPKE